jgi:fluoride exporter
VRLAAKTYGWVALGSALGGVSRYACTLLAAALVGEDFPWGTILVNILGSFVIGAFATLTGPDGRLLVRSEIRAFVMTGLCGGYTTFSAFSLQSYLLLRGGDRIAAAANIVSSIALCLLAVWLGDRLAVALSRPRRR